MVNSLLSGFAYTIISENKNFHFISTLTTKKENLLETLPPTIVSLHFNLNPLFETKNSVPHATLPQLSEYRANFGFYNVPKFNSLGFENIRAKYVNPIWKCDIQTNVETFSGTPNALENDSLQ